MRRGVGTTTYRAVSLPPLQDIVQVQVRHNLVRQPVPDPVVAVLFLVLVLELLSVDVGRCVPGAVGPALDVVKGSRASHADVDSHVDPVALVRLPELGHQLPHSLIADPDGLRMDEDTNGGEVDGSGACTPILGKQSRQLRGEALGNLPGRVDRILVTKGLPGGCVSEAVSPGGIWV